MLFRSVIISSCKFCHDIEVKKAKAEGFKAGYDKGLNTVGVLAVRQARKEGQESIFKTENEDSGNKTIMVRSKSRDISPIIPNRSTTSSDILDIKQVKKSERDKIKFKFDCEFPIIKGKDMIKDMTKSQLIFSIKKFREQVGCEE